MMQARIAEGTLSLRALWVRLSVCCVLVGVGMLAIGCQGKPPVVKCYSDRDCPSNYRCDKSVKVGTTAEGNADVAQERAAIPCEPGNPSCGGGGTTSTNTAGACVIIPKPSGCYSDRDCASGQYCKPHQSSGPPSTTCTTNASGRTACIRKPFTGYCADKPKVRKCKSNNDCASDEICETKAGTTTKARCGASTTDREGLRAPCDPMPEPPTTEGVCVKKPKPQGCTSDSDCARGEVCERKATKRVACGGGTKATPGTDDRAAMPNCTEPAPAAGVCVRKPLPPKPPVRTCRNDRGCGNGEFCDLNAPQQTEPDHGGDDDERRADPAPPTSTDGGSGFMPPEPEPPVQRGICRPKPSVSFCASDKDCKRGYRCGKGNPHLAIRCSRNKGGIGCMSWRPNRRGICQPAPVTRCYSDRDCKRGQRCVATGSGNDAPTGKRAPCEPGGNCGMPAPPPQGICQ